jgi:PAS domain S-box-containing protein
MGQKSDSIFQALSQDRTGAVMRYPWILAGAGLVLFHIAWQGEGNETGFWLPGLGLGIALISWVGWRILPVLMLDLFLARLLAAWGSDQTYGLILANTLLHGAQIGLSWWLYHCVLRGSRWLDDPRSATEFLIVIPGVLSALAAVVQGIVWRSLQPADESVWPLIAVLWLSRMVGTLVVLPFLLVVVTPLLLRWRLVTVDMPTAFFGETLASLPRRGEWIELIGLTFATTVLAQLLLQAHLLNNMGGTWTLWGCCLVLLVWICIRQGLRGGCFAAGITSAGVLVTAEFLHLSATPLSALQANLLAFCSTALLVGVSSSWVRANEARYRHVVAHIPVLLYSARMPHGIPSLIASEQHAPMRDSKHDGHLGSSISRMANVLLVSPASQLILGSPPEALMGPYARWLEQIVPEDHELVVAALAQLCLQKTPVTCEYRIRMPAGEKANESAPHSILPRSGNFQLFRWVRDTLTPHYSEDGLVDGWEGLVEEITEQRALSQNLRKITNMLQVLITNLPTGVFFVQAPTGYPILVNPRARQLLGQREDMSASLAHLSRVYRLFRPDGTEYPSDELPISKAVRLGTTCQANDIVVHRADGRKIPLIAWAAPIDLHNTGVPDAAVWVLEDLSAMQQAKSEFQERDIRLRAVIATMSEGVIVQDATGTIIECNPAACAILAAPAEELLTRVGLTPPQGFVQQDGAVLPKEAHPDQRALREGKPVRDVILGLPMPAGVSVRWLHVNSMPLPVGPAVGFNYQKARVVTTFADITQQLQFQDSLRLAKEKYQNLVETLPFMMIQQDNQNNITYLNPAALQLTGYTQEQLMSPGFFQQITLSEDEPTRRAAAELVAQGQSTRVELHLLVQDRTAKTVLAFIHPNWIDGKVSGSTSLLIDISMQRRLEEELLRAKHLELVGKLASGTVHDFNNLLAVMISLAELAKMEIAEEHPAHPYLIRLVDAGEQASHLTGQILAFAKQRSKTLHPVDLNPAITQTLRLLKSIIPENITVETALQPGIPHVVGNENQLKQILLNLCLNAREAMPRGGRLTIATDLGCPDNLTPGNGETGKWVHLWIQDTGVGMEESVRARIFEPFFSTKERGTGLGLAVVQQIIKDFGGHIDVWSQPNVGTRMDIWLMKAGQ